MVAALPPAVGPRELVLAQDAVRQVHASPALIDYVQALAEYTRTSDHWQSGLSPRAALALLSMARAWAWLAGRDHVLPEDVQAVLGPVAGHRLRPRDDAAARRPAGSVAEQLIEAVPLP